MASSSAPSGSGPEEGLLIEEPDADETSSSSGWPEGSEFLTLDFSPNREIVHRWRKLPDCDEFVGARRSKHTMVAYKGAIYVFGGDNGKQMLNDLIRYDPSDNSWGRAFTMGTLPAPRYHHTAVVFESSMYVFGGYTGDIHSNSNLTNKNDLFEYKFSTGQWSEVRCERRLPPARSGHGAIVYDGKLWVLGGFDGHTRLNDMWCLSLAGPIRRWQEVNQHGEVPPPCHNFASTLLGNCLYLFSGQSGTKGSNSLFQFHLPTTAWTRISTEHVLRATAPAPHRRYGHTMVAHNKNLYVFGGAAESIQPPELHCYTLETHTWHKISACEPSTCPCGRLFHSAVMLGDAMYVFGGTIDNNVRNSEIFRFQFSSYPSCTLHDDFGRLLESRQLCDLRFVVGNKDRGQVPVYAHIPIVAARSVYLRNKIMQSREQGAQELAAADLEPLPDSPGVSNDLMKSCEPAILDVAIDDAEPFAFEMVLDYIYTDKIDPTQRGQEPGSNGVVLLMMAVYRLALQFSMKRLEGLAVQYLESVLGVRNVLVALQNASRLNLHYIKEYCLKFIHILTIRPFYEFETLEQPLMVEIIRRRQIPSFRPLIDLSSVKVEGPTLEDDMKAFLDDGVGADFCDVTLVCNDVSIPVHKVILAARSAYFDAMFRNWMPETNTVNLTLGEVVPSPHAFRSLLSYIYYGCTGMPPEDSLFLFAAPPFYGFSNNRLQVFCKENLEMNIKTENVLEILEAADKIQANEMKRHALKLIVAHFSKVARQPTLRNLSRELLLDIIEAVAQGSNQDLNALHQVADASDSGRTDSEG